MNNYDQEFKRIVDGLEIDDKPGGEHKDRLRWQMMSEFNSVRSDGRSGQVVFSRIGRFIMERKFASLTAAAVIIVAIIIGVSVSGGPNKVDNNIVDNDQKNGNVEQVVKDENSGAVAKDTKDNGPGSNSFTPAKKEAELKHVQELFAAKDVDGLVEVLKTGSSEGKLAAATYLADMGADSAVDEIKKLRDSWGGKEKNPKNQEGNPFIPLVRKIEAAKSGVNDANTVKGGDGTNDVGSESDGVGAVSAIDKDNELETAFGLKVIDKVTGKPVAGADVKVYSQGGRGLKTNQFGRCLIELGDKKPDHLTVNVSKGKYSPRRLFFCPANNGIAIPKNYVLQLEAGTVIGGIVKTVDGDPVKDATVKVRMNEDMNVVNNPAISGLPFKTDKHGRWVCDVIPADAKNIYLEVSHADLVAAERYGSRASIDKLRDKRQVLLMCDGIDVVGSVVDVNGRPIAGANVFQGFSKHSRDQKTKTDASGKFVFKRSTPGEMILCVTAAGFAQDLKIVRVARGLEEVETVLDEGGSMILRFVDVDGNPVEGVEIEAIEWRKKTMEQSYENVRIVEQSDVDGLAVIMNVPDEEVIYSIFKKDYAGYRKMLLAPSDKEQKIVVYKPGKLVGKVIDSQTGEPVKEFMAIEGVQEYRPRESWWKTTAAYWQNHRKKKGTDGRYELPFNTHLDGYAVKIEADGYLPQVSPIFYNKGKTVEHDIYLSRGEGPSGLVYHADGTAAVNAEVIIATKERGVYIENNSVRNNSSTKRTVTDKDGAFMLPAVRGDYKLVVIHDKGIAIVTKDQFEKTGAIIVEKWGRVEGLIYKGAQLAANTRVHISREYLYSLAGDDITASYQMEVKSNDKGEFVFEKVIPGKLTVCKIVELSDSSWSYANKTPVDVTAGKGTVVEIGGGGRKITGKVVVPAGVSLEGLNSGGLNLKTKVDKSVEPIDLPEISYPEDILVMSLKERNAWQAKFTRSDEGKAFLKKIQEIQLAESSILKNYPVRFEADGSFVIEDVLPGRYELTGLIHDISLKGTDEYYRSTVCKIKHEVVVEEIIDGSDFDKPLALGAVKVAAFRKLKVGDVAPGFELKGLDGKMISLSDFKGKYLLLEKSMLQQADFNTKVLPEMIELYGKFGGDKFDILAVYPTYVYRKDLMEKPVRYYIKHFGIGWTIGLDEISMFGGKQKIKEDYGTDRGVMYLIGPDGKIVAIESDIKKIKQTVEKLLTADE